MYVCIYVCMYVCMHVCMFTVTQIYLVVSTMFTVVMYIYIPSKHKYIQVQCILVSG